MLLVSYLYVTALIATGSRVSENRPKSIVMLAGTLVSFVYMSFLLALFFWLMITEVSIVEGMELWSVIEMLFLVLISYLVMVAPGFIYIFKIRIKELQKYGYYSSNT